MVASLDVLLDDAALPALRTESRTRLLGGSFGWRADNRLRGHVKLASSNPASRLALELLAARRVDRPYDPMWTLDHQHHLDDYGAHRAETGLGGGAYWNDEAWVRVHDPRLVGPPRSIRFSVGAVW